VPADYASRSEVARWIGEVSSRLASRIPDAAERRDLLASVHYEAVRAGLDPQLVLGVIHHESGFKKYAVSVADARGYMQVMPFWTRLIGDAGHNLFHLRTNLRYGCVILRHYLDIERGNLFRALGRYNGSLGKPEYPNMVERAWQRDWSYPTRAARTAPGGDHPSRSTFAGAR
jgi:soluble lytic murein transglycosylase-like protein